jgi:Domain of unknown function (DUF4145)
MVKKLSGSWFGTAEVRGNSYTCGYCGLKSGPSRKYYCKDSTHVYGDIFICPNCNRPTFISISGKEQVPGPILGEEVEHLPSDVEQLYTEARKCISVNAFTSSVLSCRKLLMNISVSNGAEAGKSFAYYVAFLEENHFIPPNSRGWVDHIRKKGNEATHEIPNITRDDAVELIEFTEMLLRFVYELPGKMAKHSKAHVD